TENSENVFSATVPYLKGVPDPYDSANGQNSLHSWKRDWSLDQMQSFVNSSSSTAVGTLQSIEFLAPLGVSGRVAKVINPTGGGVRVAVCHFGEDATDSIVTSPGAGGGPHVRVFNAAGVAAGGGFMAYDPTFTGGVYVGCGDVDPTNTGDEIITGPGAGGGPH